jgi:prepilin-type N-terminal cleavage/methylation domain-containing protein
MVMHTTVRGRKPNGFTMVEVMVVMAIMGILALAGSKLMTQIQNYFFISRARLVTQQEARNIITMVAQDLRQARSSTIAVSRDPGQPPASRVYFVKVGDPGMPDVPIVYVQRGAEFFRIQNNGVPVSMSKNVRFVAFTFPRTEIPRELISVSLTLERGIQQGKTKALHMASESIGVMN